MKHIISVYVIDLENTDEIDYFSEEILKETKIYSNEKDKIFIAVHPDEGRNFDKDPYIKVSFKPNISNDSTARLSLKTGQYIIHNKMTATINGKIVKQLNKALYSKCRDTDKVKKINSTIEKEISKSNSNIDHKTKILHSQKTNFDSILFDIHQITGKDFLQLKENIKPIEFKPLH